MSVLVGVVDYGMGNLTSVCNAFESLNVRAEVLATPQQLSQASHIILPGVGAFGDAMKNLNERGWTDALNRFVKDEGRPFLGICLGLQLLATTGTEHGNHQGLNWIAGKVVRFEISGPVPHVGWNDVVPSRQHGCMSGFDKPGVFYFVHSYFLQPEDESVVDGWCEYEQRFAASVCQDNIWAVQFHPEKSQKHGLQVLKNFIDRCPAR